MLIITIEKKDANTGVRETLHTLIIANDGTGTRDVGNYDWRVETPGRAYITGRVEKHHRWLLANGLWRLLRFAVMDIENRVADYDALEDKESTL